MADYVYVQSTSNASGDLTLTRDYFVIKGKHYIFRDWYLHNCKNDVALLTGDIIGIELIPYRSKKALVVFIVLASVFLAFATKLYRLNSGIFFVMLFACVVALIKYFCFTIKLFRVTSRGVTVAVNSKYYAKNQLEYLIACWNKSVNIW